MVGFISLAEYSFVVLFNYCKFYFVVINVTYCVVVLEKLWMMRAQSAERRGGENAASDARRFYERGLHAVPESGTNANIRSFNCSLIFVFFF